MIKRIAPILLLLAFLPLPLFAQQVGASVTGHVIDPSGAVISGANIKLTSTLTGAVYPTASDSAGIYQLPFVLIGSYTLTVEKQGFKKYVQQGITLSTAQKAVIDITLQLGAVTQSISVTANAQMVNTESGDRTATISNVRLDPEVFRGQNTIVTTWFTPGVVLVAGVQKIRPWDNAGTQAENINGGQSGQGNTSVASAETGQTSGNQTMVDGISINRGGNGTGYNPIAATVDQVTVVGTLYDAQYGWSTGGHINTITKSGSNTWHGHGYDYLQNTIFNAEDYASKVAGTGRLPWHINMYGGEIGGALRKDKIFVYAGYGMIWQIQRDPFIVNVPTAAEAQGNFNGLLNTTGGSQVTLYDPSTTGTCLTNGSTACRSTSGPLVANNVILHINPIAAKVLAIVPPPNAPGSGSAAQCTSAGITNAPGGICGTFAGNDITGPTDRKFLDYFPQEHGRIDWNFSDRTHAFFRFAKNDLIEERSYVYSTVAAVNLAETSGNNPLFRGNQAYALQVTHTFNPTTVLEFRTGMDRYPSGGGDGIGVAIDPTTLGFSSTFGAEAFHTFPQMRWTGQNGAGSSPPSYTASDIWTTELVLAHTSGKHNMRVGYQNFVLGEYSEGPGNNNGAFTFTGYFTDQNPYGSVGSTGYGLADFELGYPASATINVPAWPLVFVKEHSFFVQDDYHATRKLTLNFGLRWDYEGPAYDKYNRLLNGFCTTCASPLAIPGFALVGGPTFAGANNAPAGIFHPKYDNFGPRFGFAYALGHDMVVRGGFGIVYAQRIEYVGAAPGYNVSPSFNSTVSPGIPNPAYTFANPFPAGLPAIAGNSWGLATNVGAGLNVPNPNMDIPRTMQYSLEVQKSLGRDWLFSLGYVGSDSKRLNVNQPLNFVPRSYIKDQSPQGLATETAYLGTQVANPFLNLPATSPYYSYFKGNNSGYFNSTIAQSTLAEPYPQFGGITQYYTPIGTSHYHSLQLAVNKRLGYGLEFSANFTWSKTLQATGFLNSSDTYPQQTIAPYDTPRVFNLNFAYFAPFGPGKKFLNSTNPVLSRVVSGWSLSITPMIHDGFPLPNPNYGGGDGWLQPTGASRRPANQSITHWINTCTETAAVYNASTGVTSTPTLVASTCKNDSAAAWQQTVPNQLITWSPYYHDVRYTGIHRTDASIKKETTIKEKWQLTYRADFINAFNSTEWFTNMDNGGSSSTFGSVGYPSSNTPLSDPRVIEMSLQIKF
ncbi:MAG: carboxypeptidase-like regulatory domain-containing protein [Terriglobia bacterium]